MGGEDVEPGEVGLLRPWSLQIPWIPTILRDLERPTTNDLERPATHDPGRKNHGCLAMSLGERGAEKQY
jgi:hypothetical protein